MNNSAKTIKSFPTKFFNGIFLTFKGRKRTRPRRFASQSDGGSNRLLRFFPSKVIKIPKIWKWVPLTLLFLLVDIANVTAGEYMPDGPLQKFSFSRAF
ncbi:MAG: hypothetical protein WBC16_01635 [Candidatus Omnitrophota bacterium]